MLVLWLSTNLTTALSSRAVGDQIKQLFFIIIIVIIIIIIIIIIFYNLT